MKKNNKFNFCKIFASLLLIILFIVSLSTIVFLKHINNMEKITIDKSDLNISKEGFNTYKEAKEIKNIALFGIDSEDGNIGRSDAIMIATLDTYHNKIKLTSIMRDSYVNIPDRGMDKINHAYAFGGPQLSLKTINENFGLNIDSFISVNFSSMPKIIDILGGVDINITKEEVPFIPGINASGIYSLNGNQALSYSRIRYTAGGDYIRTERHRTVLNAIFNKLLSLSVTDYTTILNSIFPFIQTNLSASDILSLGTKVFSITGNGLEQERFPRDGFCNGIMLNDIYYLSFDAEVTKKQFMDYIFNDIK